MTFPDLSVIRDEVLALNAYEVQDSSGLVKLDAMENPYVLPNNLATALGHQLAAVALNRYPPSNPQALKSKLATHMNVPSGMSLMLGNGSDELIHLVIQACAKPGAVVLSPWPSFVMYEMSAKLNGCRFVGVPLNGDFTLDRNAMLAAVKTHRPAVTFVSYPNNPTGNLFDGDTLVAMIRAAAPGLVVMDEAYVPFALKSWMSQLNQLPNLLVLRTLSKMGLAGIRLGYLTGHSAWIEQIEKARLPYNVNALTLAAADLLLDHMDLFEMQAAAVRTQRAQLLTSLRTYSQLVTYDSSANFILFRTHDPDQIWANLKQQGILVKNVSYQHSLLTGCLRVTVGTPLENDAFLAALTSVL